MSLVAWDESARRELYPQFSEGQPYYCTSAQLAQLWTVAVTLVDNTDGAAIPYDPSAGVYVRQILLWALMCHLATLAWQGRQGQYGTLNSATESPSLPRSSSPSFPRREQRVPGTASPPADSWRGLCSGATRWAGFPTSLRTTIRGDSHVQG